MLQFQELTAAHGDRLRGYYRNCDYRLCEYSLGVKLMWRDHLHPSFAEVAGCLVIRNCIEGEYVFDYPIAGPEADVEGALRPSSPGAPPPARLWCSLWCRRTRPRPSACAIPAAALSASDPGRTIFTEQRSWPLSPAVGTAASATTSTSSAGIIPTRNLPC